MELACPSMGDILLGCLGRVGKECDPGRIDLRWDEWRIDCRHKDSSRLLLSIQLWDQVSQAGRRIRWFLFDWNHDGALVVIWVCFWKCLMCIHCRKVAIMIWPSWWWTSTSISIWRRWKAFLNHETFHPTDVWMLTTLHFIVCRNV